MGPKNSLGRSLSERRDARGVLNTYPFGFQKKGSQAQPKKTFWFSTTNSRVGPLTPAGPKQTNKK
jgi:hypothetical protein